MRWKPRTINQANAYTAYGAVFGICFPVGAIAFLYLTGHLGAPDDVAEAVRRAHGNVLLYIIDTAPFFLGLFARLAGKRQDRLLMLSAGLEQQVAEKTESLRRALDEAQKANQMIAHMAEHDTLTGLFNRRRFHEELQRWTQHVMRYERSAALLFMDLDQFKYVNDTHGHAVGDQYLIRISALLTNVLRSTDLIARWGGDEFAVLLPETGRDGAIEVAKKIQTLFTNSTINIDGHELLPSISIGIALLPDHSKDLNELIAFADAAMYEAKAGGRSCWRLYSASEQEMQRVQEHVQWERRLRRALENDQFLLFYQPLLNLRTNSTCGYEALLRLEDREGQLIGPGLFLESAERVGLSLPIDRMVIRKTARRLASLADENLWVSLNLSRKSLQDPDLFAYIEQMIEETRLRKGQLGFEITESAVLENIRQARDLGTKLHELGCRFVLDDVGAGFLSFRHLRELPIDMIKIDGALIRSLAQGESQRMLIKNIAAIAHEADIGVTAKFVEDAAQLDLLRMFGVDYAQGFAIGRPMESIEHARDIAAA